MIEILQFTLGPVETNAYLVADPVSRDAVAVDPAWDGTAIARAASEGGYTIRQIWLTHAHFDHLGGVAALCRSVQPQPPVALHSEDLPLWGMRGGADLFGFRIETGPKPTILLEKVNQLSVGQVEFEVRHAPGHTPGHVVFYSSLAGAAFCGDVIFAGAIGRTDLPGGNFYLLMQSIQQQIMSLPDETRLLSGHGPETTVGEERQSNPFLTELDF
jgi:glyoxylase-like metal-dependent hydrolase (beta-lactamase superfamily II)